jgi:murein DD-endopeptidase MepM/ murein hydrolase activator NlpD
MSLVVAVAIVAACWPGTASAAPPWTWPAVGAIVRGYDPPDDPYGAGHRGIDIATAVGTTIVAPDDGVVSFAGPVGGRLFLSIDHGEGLISTSSFLTSLLVRKGARVVRGQPVATTAWGHADLPTSHLHFGVRRDGAYVDPLDLLEPPAVTSFIRLAPLEEVAPMAAGRMTGLAYPMALVAVAGAPRARVRSARVRAGRRR